LKVWKSSSPPTRKRFARQAVDSGRLRREEDAVTEALSLWAERERTRAEILAAVDEAESSLARGQGRTITRESVREPADDVKQRGCARVAAERPPSEAEYLRKIAATKAGGKPRHQNERAYRDRIVLSG
jgi:hypothetical protein